MRQAHASCLWRIVRCDGGFTLIELILVVGIISIMSAIAVPAFSSLYGDYCLKAAVWELKDMFKDAKLLSIQDKPCAITFDPLQGKATLCAGKGPDEKWDTGDEQLIRETRLSNKGGALSFGYGNRGPVRKPNKLVEAEDGISFTNNRFASDEGLVGSSGSVYIQSASSGGAMVLTFNTIDFSCAVRKWDGKDWVEI
ncbi:prepilin-type N-terminal cleavage/methylation domain-containing protein [Geobacter hydrogenophilus]|uniref:Pilus biosynthesis protein PilE n=2 Tax=Geobacter hydrogenophilus TaxID=40983 RepID=A0A9W6FYC9_9BACT|nr:prepilin-type N-terminal cleavage/methylation domain-containing protein [Geobacter hydrogenophilus]MBT0894961.1 prepilin-type N-terminal cleavage/methylation domain-containing protein [Geobacter hydrogenophilus]GLI37068.1 pilus biosynthesis protein PilE [Geobacter hydrogenophilus]